MTKQCIQSSFPSCPCVQVFGAFISSELVGRHGARFFGNGESFVFSLKPVNECYRWSRETDLILRGTDRELAVGSGGG